MRFNKNEDGVIFVEVVVALGLIVAATFAVITVLSQHSIATRSSDANDVAINLVNTQLEVIKNSPYSTYNPPCYSRTVTYPTAEYTVTISVVPEPGYTTLQKVTVAAKRGSTTYLSVEMYKANLGGGTSSASCTS